MRIPLFALVLGASCWLLPSSAEAATAGSTGDRPVDAADVLIEELESAGLPGFSITEDTGDRTDRDRPRRKKKKRKRRRTGDDDEADGDDGDDEERKRKRKRKRRRRGGGGGRGR